MLKRKGANILNGLRSSRIDCIDFFKVHVYFYKCVCKRERDSVSLDIWGTCFSIVQIVPGKKTSSCTLQLYWNIFKERKCLKKQGVFRYFMPDLLRLLCSVHVFLNVFLNYDRLLFEQPTKYIQLFLVISKLQNTFKIKLKRELL